MRARGNRRRTLPLDGWRRVPTALGPATIGWRGEGLALLALPPAGPPGEPGAREAAASEGTAVASSPSPAMGSPPPWFDALVADVQAHLAACRRSLRIPHYAYVPLAPPRSAFAAAVYAAARSVQPGTVCTYGELARLAGRPPRAARAVGAALGANPTPLVVP